MEIVTERLSENFTLAEMCVTTHRFPNTPNADQKENLRAWCINIGEPVRAHFKAKYPDRKIIIKVNSGFRSKAVNDASGGEPYRSPKKPGSQHLYGQAVDFEIPGVPNVEVFEFIRDSGIPFDQLIAEKLKKDDGAAGWIHVSFAMKCRRLVNSCVGYRKYVPGLEFIA